MAQSAFAARKAAQSREQSDNLKGTSTQVQHTEYLNDSGEQPHQPELKPRKKRRRLDAGITGFLNTSAGDLDQDGLVQNGWPIRLNNEAAILQVQFHASADQSISEVRVRVKDQPILDPVQSDDPASKTLQPDLKSILVWDETYQTLDINLQPGNSVSVVGEYDLWVKKGSIRLLGATIHASSDSFRVQSPTTHSIPSIEALSNPFGPASQEIDIRLSSCSSGLRRLRQCDPRFSRIWHNREYNAASFEVIENEKPESTSLFSVTKDWQLQVSKLLESEKLPVVMICGPKNVGKSSFAKFLSNSFISRKFAETGLAYLDLDPGQPEYTAPADLSLSHVKTFNFGPNFSHPSLIGTQRSKTLRQHHYGHMSPRDDWNHYLDCASDLYHHYESTLKSAGCPIIINTCGWVQGSGLDLLDTLTVRLKPSRIVCFTSSETDEMISLQKQHRKEVVFINSRAFPPNSTSAADLRSMQHCSFFHLEEPENRNLHWHANPILKSQTIDLAYASTRKIISAILLLGDRINYDMLDDAIDRTVMALVAIEDSSAVSNALLAIEDESLDDAYMDIHTEPEEDIVFESEEDALVVSQQYILRKNSRGLPFLCTNSGNNPPLDPSKTRSLGQVLLNSIDHDQQILRIHTPISQSDIKVCVDQGLSLILVRGRLGTPEWSYLEEYVHAKTIQEDIVDLQGLDQADAANDDFDFDVVAWAKRTPYVEYQSTQGKRNRSKVRRIRRNLGGKPSS